MFDLRTSPFYLLGVSPRDNRAIIAQAAETAITEGVLDEAVATRAQQILMSPRLRLGAELSWTHAPVSCGFSAPSGTRYVVSIHRIISCPSVSSSASMFCPIACGTDSDVEEATLRLGRKAVRENPRINLLTT